MPVDTGLIHQRVVAISTAAAVTTCRPHRRETLSFVPTLQVLDASVLQSRTKVDPKWLQGRANAAWRGAAVRLRLQSMLNPNTWKQAPQKLFGLSLRGNALIGRARSASATAPLAAQRAALTLNARVDISGRDFTLESPDQTDDVRVPGEQPQIAVGQWGKSRRVQFSRLPPMSGTATKALDNNTVLSTDVHINRTLAHATGWHKVRWSGRSL